LKDLHKDYAKCLNVIRIDPKTDEPHEPHNADHCGYGSENWKECIWPKIKEYIENKPALIDIGAGNGRRSKFFSDHVSEVVAIDVAQLVEGKQYNNILTEGIANVEFVHAEFIDYEAGNRKFDVAYCEGSFYYMQGVHGVEKTFEKIESILKDDGYIIILEGIRDKEYTAIDLAKRYDFEYCKIVNNPGWGSCSNNRLRILGEKHHDT